VIPNGVDLSHFSPGDPHSARAQLQIEPRAVAIAFVAQKAVDNPLKDFATLRSALELLGRSPGPPVIALALGAVGDDQTTGRVTIRFMGQVAHEHVRDYLRAVDLYVHTVRWENHPLAVLEALACGVPVIGTAVGGVPEQVRSTGIDPDPTGTLVPVGDVAGLATTMQSLLENSDTLRAMGAAARRDAEARFDVSSQVSAYLELYDRLGADRQ
jgi:glycosyltransferase involved in cell wall biosynthesis